MNERQRVCKGEQRHKGGKRRWFEVVCMSSVGGYMEVKVSTAKAG